MSCFKDILYQSIKSKNNLPIIIILSSCLAYIQICRSYYIGKITQNRSIKDVIKFIREIKSLQSRYPNLDEQAPHLDEEEAVLAIEVDLIVREYESASASSPSKARTICS